MVLNGVPPAGGFYCLSVLALSSRFDGRGGPRHVVSGRKSFSTRSVESF